MERRWLPALVALVGLGFLARRARVTRLLRAGGELDTRVAWKLLRESPDGSESYPPQGMVFADGTLYVTAHWHGKKSELYRVDPGTGAVEASAAMPADARHTSGLAWVDGALWALDHASNALYRLDLEETFAEGEAAVEERYDTGLRGASGLTAMGVAGEDYLAVSDFVWTIETTPPLPLGTGRTFLVALDDVRAGREVREAATVSYDNGGYSQGLAWDGEYLYESANNRGTDRVEVLEVAQAIERGDSELVRRRGSFEGPAGRIEDLGTDGERLWTTDEGTYGLYRLDDLDGVKGRLGD